MKRAMLSLQRDNNIYNNVMKRGGHGACFHATILTNMIIFAAFWYVGAQQISSIFFFQCRALYHTV